LGYFDGRNGKAFVMPVVDDERDGYVGVEYVSLYDRIAEEKAKNGNMNLYVKTGDEYVLKGR
jgi:hypothetical protein